MSSADPVAALSHYTARDGTRLALHRTGEGPPIVLLHGLFSDARTNWIKFGHAAAIAAKGYAVLMPDFRAHGDSPSPQDAADWPPGVLLDDVADLVAHEGLGTYDLGGFSLGARTALQGVATGRLTPRRLVAAGMGLEGLTGWDRRAAFFTGVIDRFDTIRPGEPEYFARQFMKTQGVDRVAARHLLGTMSDVDPASLATIAVPTLIVCGVNDDDNGSATALAAALPNAEYRGVPGTHMSSVAKPDLGLAMAEWLGTAC